MSRILADTDTNVTESNVGPLRWMAPELLLYQTYSTKTDAWSFGVMMSEIFNNGEIPYSKYSPSQAASLVVTKQIKLSLPEGVHPTIKEVFDRTQEFEPNDRAEFNEVGKLLSNL